MSGRELAFDRRAMHDLTRQLQFAPPRSDLHEARSPHGERPDTSFLVEAVANAAASISAKDERILQFEEQQRGVEDLVDRMKSKLGELTRLKQTADVLAKSETERADRAEAKAIRLESRVEDLESDLEAALGDLHRIADVITGSLIAPGRR